MSAFETEWEKPEFDSVPSLAENAVYLLPECNDVILRKTLQEVYRDFCKRSAALRTWRKAAPSLHGGGAAVAPVLSGEIDCVTQVCLVGPGWHRHVHDWRFAGNPPMLCIPHLAEHDFFVGRFDANLVQHRVNVGTLPPEDGAEEPPRPMPVAVWVEAVEIPSLNEERAPKAFLRRHGDAIVDGALARLFSMSGRPWSDPEQARQRGLSYSNALSEARQRGMNGGPDANAGRGFALDLSSMV